MTHTPYDIPPLLRDQIALVTGAGQGNGKAIATGFSTAGARVVVTDIRRDTATETAEEIRSLGGNASAYELDVTDTEACVALAETMARDFGQATVVVNNAGILIRESMDSPDAHENWRKVMDVNVNGVFNVTHAWLSALRRTKGCIINIASIASYAGVGNAIGYSPSKGAVKMMTQTLARDLAPDGIRVNALAPGVIATPMTASTRADKSRLDGFMSRTPAMRVGDPEELIGPAIFLASPMSSYVNGAVLPVDGGFLAV